MLLLPKEPIMMNAITRFVRDEEGATAIEYGVIAGLVTILLVAIFGQNGAFGIAMTNMFGRIGTLLNNVTP